MKLVAVGIAAIVQLVKEGCKGVEKVVG